jgi:hypothetical protein
MNATLKTIPAAIADAITSDVQTQGKAEKQRGKTLDLLQAEGVSPAMLEAPAKDADRTFYDSVCRAIVAGFAPVVRSMLAGEAKALKTIGEDQAKANRTAKCRENRKYWQQRIGSVMRDYRVGLERRIAAAEAAAAEAEDGEDGEGAGNKGTQEARWRKALSTIVTQAQKAEGAMVKDLPAFVRDIESAIARITAPAEK